MPAVRWLPILAALVFLWIVRAILPPFVVAAVLAFALAPWVERAEAQFRVPRAVIVGAFYLLFLLALALAGFFFVPALTRESRDLIRNLPQVLDQAILQISGSSRIDVLGTETDAARLSEQLSRALSDFIGRPEDVVRLAETAIEGILTLFVFLVAFFYLLLDGRRIGEYVLRLVPSTYRSEVQEVVGLTHAIFGRYLRGQLFLVGLMSLVSWLVLALGFHLRFALPIAVATGVLELIPYAGPLLAGGIAAGTGLATQGPATAAGIAIAYFILRQVEDQLIMPNVVGRAVHLHPVVVIFSVLAGSRIAGVLGMLLAVPVAAALAVAVDYWVIRRDREAPAPDAV